MNASTDPRDIAATPPARATFPFAALIGQDALQQALLLAAIDPGLGGVLVSGPRGTAKSTAARALAELLPEGQLVTLPLGASEERLIGTLDIETVLRDGSVKFSPGLLAKAHRGVLYVDEINLLPDALVDALLDAAASGVNSVERDGISHSHEASFVLIGTMNPEQAAYMQRIHAARERLPNLTFSESLHEHVSRVCIEAAVDGLRADLVMLRAARALAALEQETTVATGHVDRVAEAVLAHRRHERETHAAQPPDRQPAPQRQSDSTQSHASQEESDWGHLPPEPTGTANVKGVIPLPAKKR